MLEFTVYGVVGVYLVALVVFILITLNAYNNAKTKWISNYNQAMRTKDYLIDVNTINTNKLGHLQEELDKKQNVIRLLRRQARKQEKLIKQIKPSK